MDPTHFCFIHLRYLARVGDLEATNTEDPDLNYGLVVDCGSSGSRIFVYFWPRHNGNPHDLLDIKQMRDRNSQPVVKKIKPGTQQNTEEAAKILLAEFNLGCDVQHTEHVYRVYVTTFLGFGGNFARQRYEELVLNETLHKNRLLGQKTGLSPDNPFLDPCLPVGLTDVVERNSQVLHDYCGMAWSVLTQRFKNGLFSAHADEHRLKYQCFKSAWMYQVLHEGFHFPYDYPNLQTAQLVYDREVQWTLGAILYKTRFLPLRDLRQGSVRQAHGSWLRLSFVYNHYLFFACTLVVLLAIFLYLLRIHRIHRRQTRASAPLDLLWIEQVVPMIGVQVGP
ncbi:hypothetical protein A6R68_12620 [Neotoma lepida]|uniref:Ectonucleoside triphosphate diphosphohydrolase 7 n=1 Tax=Neotoma lepida TaxID=56216 RepID=A0A1A6H2J4_NEOLE|nr:hypothetical protein A6R68_12620 [Neotoma lepida]